jgi:tetratricopeptide (TPR) repeat protein
LGYVSYFANYLACAVFLGWALYSVEEDGWWKRAGALAAGLAAVAIVLSGTRAAMLGVALGALYLRPRLRARGIGVAAAAVAALAVFAISPAGQLLRSRFHWTVEEPLGGARLLLFRDSLRLAGSHPVTGIGPEAFSAEFPLAQSAALSEAYPDFYHESPHNILLDALTAQGALGALALVGLIALGFYAAGGALPALGACLVAGVVAHQFAVFTAPTAVYFYLTIAFLVGAPGRSLVATPELPAGGKRPAGGPTADRGGYPTLLLSTISILLLGLAVRLIVGDWKLQRVKTELAAGQRAAAILEYSSARDWGLSADVWYSNQMAAAALKAPNAVEALKAWQQALEAGVRATKTADDPHNAWYSLAALHARQNDFERTEACLRQAIASSPTWFKPHWMLARILTIRGRRDEAKAEAELAARFNGGKNPEVSQTLADGGK